MESRGAQSHVLTDRNTLCETSRNGPLKHIHSGSSGARNVFQRGGRAYNPHGFREDVVMLTRMIGEIIRIADHITVTVLGMKGSQVRLGSDAPKDILVHLEEIFECIQHERDPQPE